MFQISITTLLSFLLLFAYTNHACLSPTQLDGLCTACPNNHKLMHGFCLPHIPGCMNQISPHLCSQCSQGYTLANNFCSPPSSNSAVIDQQYYLQLFGRGRNYRYEYLDFYFKGKYINNLQDKISNVSMLFQLKTTYGFVYAITYTNPFSEGGTIFRAEGLVDYYNVITEYRFEQINYSNINDYKQLIWRLQRKAIINGGQNSDVTLNEVQQLSTNDYRLFYIGFQGQIYVCDVQRVENTTSQHMLFPQMTQLYYSVTQQTVINYVFSLFPAFQIHSSYTINSYTIIENGVENQYYKFIFDSQIIVIIKVSGVKMILFSYEEPDNIVQLSQNGVGGYLPLGNLQDTLYLEVYQFVVQQYPFLTTKTVQSVRYQVVAGTNFIIIFSSYPFSDNIYQVAVHKPLGMLPSVITSLHKNGVDVSNTIVETSINIPGVYNYQADHTFKQLYSYFREKVQMKISSLLPIASVQPVMGVGVVDYMVVFTHQEYAFLRYDPTHIDGSYHIVSFTSFGVAINLEGGTTTSTNNDRGTVLDFIQTTNPSLFGKSIVLKYMKGDKNFEVDILTQYGIYFTRTYQKNILLLSKVQQLSTSLCSDLDPSQHTNNPIISSLNQYILQNYVEVSGYKLTLVQGYVSSEGNISYRMLYSLGDNRYQVKVVQQSGKYMINSLKYFSGLGCKQDEVIINGKCQKSCGSIGM